MQPGPDRDDVAGLDLHVAEPVGGDRLAVEARHRRIEPHRLLEDPAQQRQPVGQAGIVLARGERGLGLRGGLGLQIAAARRAGTGSR